MHDGWAQPFFPRFLPTLSAYYVVVVVVVIVVVVVVVNPCLSCSKQTAWSPPREYTHGVPKNNIDKYKIKKTKLTEETINTHDVILHDLETLPFNEKGNVGTVR